MADPARLEPPVTGPVALVRWAWGAYREARARGLVRLDPARRRRRWWVGPVFGLAGWLSPLFYVGAPRLAVTFGTSPNEIMDFVVLCWILFLFAMPLIAAVLGVRAFLLERRTGTIDALRMTAIRRDLLVMTRFVEALRPLIWGLAGLLPACLLLPTMLTARIGGHIAGAFAAGAFVWLVEALLVFTACAFGVTGSIRYAGFARALMWVSFFLLLDLPLVIFGVYCIVAAALNLGGIVPDAASAGFAIVLGVAGIGLGLVLFPLAGLRDGAFYFDAWTAATEEAA